MKTLKINNIHTSVEDTQILKGVNLEIKTGEVHAIMGPNGTGKSTLAATIMGHYKYQVTAGDIYLDDKNVLEMTVDERSRNGIF
ncbi:MAG: ATP-binding cassette domain-containing protein, partial [Bacilli bacterium]|nr:ATP-binding cassette domain-containing protein [Bacilli bacterium]